MPTRRSTTYHLNILPLDRNKDNLRVILKCSSRLRTRHFGLFFCFLPENVGEDNWVGRANAAVDAHIEQLHERKGVLR